MASFVSVLYSIVNFYVMLIFIYILFSWFPHGKGILNDIYRVLGSVCDPYLNIFRKFIRPIGGGGGVAIDISPIIAILVLQLAMQIIARIL